MNETQPEIFRFGKSEIVSNLVEYDSCFQDDYVFRLEFGIMGDDSRQDGMHGLSIVEFDKGYLVRFIDAIPYASGLSFKTPESFLFEFKDVVARFCSKNWSEYCTSCSAIEIDRFLWLFDFEDIHFRGEGFLPKNLQSFVSYLSELLDSDSSFGFFSSKPQAIINEPKEEHDMLFLTAHNNQSYRPDWFGSVQGEQIEDGLWIDKADYESWSVDSRKKLRDDLLLFKMRNVAYKDCEAILQHNGVTTDIKELPSISMDGANSRIILAALIFIIESDNEKLDFGPFNELFYTGMFNKWLDRIDELNTQRMTRIFECAK